LPPKLLLQKDRVTVFYDPRRTCVPISLQYNMSDLITRIMETDLPLISAHVWSHL